MDSTKKYIIKYKQFAAFCDLYWYVVAVFVQHYAYARIGESMDKVSTWKCMYDHGIRTISVGPRL